MRKKAKGAAGSPVGRVLAVLSTVARLDAPSVSALAGELALPIATTHRICGQLQRLGYLQRLPGSRRWTVAPSLVKLSTDVLRSAASAAPVNAILKSLTAEVGEMSSFAIQVGDEVVYVASVESPHSLTLSFRAGRKAPLFCTSSGRLFLARLSNAELARYLQATRLPAYTRFTETDPKKLIAKIERIGAQGYAITSQEYVLHVVGAAVPVLGKGGTFYGAVSIAGPDVRLSRPRLKNLILTLKSAANRLARVISD
ncbi:MAG: IclR family transcriptional regulator [Pseudolabrys sp.]